MEADIVTLEETITPYIPDWPLCLAARPINYTWQDDCAGLQICERQGQKETTWVIQTRPSIEAWRIQDQKRLPVESLPSFRIQSLLELVEPTRDDAGQLLLALDPSVSSACAFLNFLGIPKSTLAILAEFPERHFELLKAAVLDGRRFHELLSANAALAFLYAVPLYPVGPPLRSRLRMRAKELLEHYGFVNVSARMLRKVSRTAITHERLVALRDATNKDRWLARVLSHTRSINGKMLDLLGTDRNVRELVNAQFWIELSKCDDETDLAPNPRSSLSEIRENARSFHIPLPAKSIGSEEALVSLDQRVRRKMKSKIFETIRFPPPPLSGMTGSRLRITPISNPIALDQHGHRMGNCVLDSLLKIIEGRVYFYSAGSPFWPSEATIQVIRGHGIWWLSAIEWAHHTRVSAECMSEALHWLADAQGLPKRAFSESLWNRH